MFEFQNVRSDRRLRCGLSGFHTACAIFLASSLAGCDSKSLQEDSGSLPAGDRVRPVSAHRSGIEVGPTGDAGEPIGQMTDVEMPSIEMPSIPDFDAPLADDARFFAPPKIETPSKQVMESDRGRAPIRLLGFIGDETIEPDSRKAILKVGDKMVTIAKGQAVEGIELLSIQGRSITMQRDRDRWTLSLFDQPLVNQPQSRPLKKTGRRNRTARSSNPVPRPQPWAAELPSHGTTSQPPLRFNPMADLPEPPAPPDLGELPGVDDLPGI